MSQAATVVTTVITPPTSLTTMENLFSIVHQFFDDYRTAIFILTGTCRFIFESMICQIRLGFFFSDDCVFIQ